MNNQAARKSPGNKFKSHQAQPMNPVLNPDQFRPTNRLRKLIDLIGDGDDHINIYQNPKTKLGQIFSPLVDFHFTIPLHGRFASRQGLRYYLLSIDGDEAYRRMSSNKMHSYSMARNNSEHSYPNLQFFMVQALVEQINSNPEALELILENDLPFDAYFMNRVMIQGTQNMIPTRPFDANQMIEVAQRISDAIKNDVDVDMSSYIDDHDRLEAMQNRILQEQLFVEENRPAPKKKKKKKTHKEGNYVDQNQMESVPGIEIERDSDGELVFTDDASVVEKTKWFDYPFLGVRLVLDRKVEVWKINTFLDSNFGRADEKRIPRLGLGKVRGYVHLNEDGTENPDNQVIWTERPMTVYEFHLEYVISTSGVPSTEVEEDKVEAPKATVLKVDVDDDIFTTNRFSIPLIKQSITIDTIIGSTKIKNYLDSLDGTEVLIDPALIDSINVLSFEDLDSDGAKSYELIEPIPLTQYVDMVRASIASDEFIDEQIAQEEESVNEVLSAAEVVEEEPEPNVIGEEEPAEKVTDHEETISGSDDPDENRIVEADPIVSFQDGVSGFICYFVNDLTMKEYETIDTENDTPCEILIRAYGAPATGDFITLDQPMTLSDFRKNFNVDKEPSQEEPQASQDVVVKDIPKSVFVPQFP